MATFAQLTDAVAGINTALSNVGTEIATLNATIASSITPEDSDSLLASLNAIAATLEGMLPTTP